MSKTRYLSYPYLSEESNCCTHEVLTDRLSSELGLIASKMEKYPREKEIILTICEKVYHVNGSIRGKMGISEEDLNELNDFYSYYEREVQDEIKKFVLPTGSELVCYIHLARCSGKQVVRNMHSVQREGKHVDKLLFNYMNLVSNFMFILGVYLNKQENYKEIEFISKSY